VIISRTDAPEKYKIVVVYEAVQSKMLPEVFARVVVVHKAGTADRTAERLTAMVRRPGEQVLVGVPEK